MSLPRPAFGDRAGRLAKLALVPIIGLVLTACGEQANNNATGDDAFPSLIGADGFPHDVVTTQGSEAASLYPIIFLVAVVIFVLVEGLLLLVILRGRNKGKDGDLPAQTHGNNRLEVIWTVIPLLVVMVLFAASTMVLARVEEKSDEPAVVLDVLAFRFGWTFTYKEPGTWDEQTATYQDAGVTISSSPASPSSDQPRDPAQDVVLPVGEPVLFRLNAADVIHSFYVPSFFFKRDAIPGRTNEFEVTIDEAGPLRRPVRRVLRPQPRPDVLQHPRRRAGRVRGLAGRAGRRVAPTEASAVPSDGTGSSEIATTAEKSIAFTTSRPRSQGGRDRHGRLHERLEGARTTSPSTTVRTRPDNRSRCRKPSRDQGATTQVSFVAPETPGAYLFRCELHPMQMIGTLTVVP